MGLVILMVMGRVFADVLNHLLDVIVVIIEEILFSM
jgi:hypothetical protein